MRNSLVDRPAVRRLVAVVLGVLLLSSCRVDVTVDVVVQPDGSGTMVVEAVADAELVQRVPTIADELVLDDVAAAGWIVEGPTATEEGGLLLRLTHDFATAEEATNLLRSLGPPFNDPTLARVQTGDVTNTTFAARFGLTDGFATFADDDLVAAVGSVPFADELAASGLTPAESMSATVTLDLPGEVIDDETNAEQVDGVLRWTAPLDGTILEATAAAEQAPAEGRAWARPLSIAALVLLIAWVAFMAFFIGYVAFARYRRARRHRRRHLT